jgi:hypothetical protein
MHITSKLILKRRALMKDWAQFLAESNVIPFREVG